MSIRDKAVYEAVENSAAHALSMRLSLPSAAEDALDQAPSGPEGRTPSSFTLGDGEVQDFVLSGDGRTIYVAGADGTIRAYNTESRLQTDAWHVGTDLGGIDITPDGRTLVVVEDQRAFFKVEDSFDWVASDQVYTLDVRAGSSATHLHTVIDYYPDAFFDVATTSDGKAIISGNDQWGTLTSLNLSNGGFSEYNYSIYPSTLRATSDHKHIAVMENGISDAPVGVFTSGQGITASHGGYEDDVYGYNYGVVAIDNKEGFVAQGLGSTVNVYDLKLDYKFDLNQYKDLGLGSVQGLAFSSNGRTLYILDASNQEIVAVNTAVWEPVGTYDLGGVEVVGNIYGNGLVASANGDYLAFMAADGVHLLDITKGGNRVAGTDGADTLAGGRGNDTYLVNNDGDVVNEGLNEGYDIARASVAYTLAENVEGLELIGDAARGAGNGLNNTLTGNILNNRLDGGGGRDQVDGGAGDDRLVGGAGGDVLDGGAGEDALNGGSGHDRYVVDAPGDRVVERADRGADTVEAGVSFTLSANVETLLLTGRADLSGTGNDGDNRIIGGVGSNKLSGLGGADVLEAGGGGTDRMLGGAGADTFRFVNLDASGASYANADSIGDMSAAEGDTIDLSAMDADIFTAGDQAFTFIGRDAFSGAAGELQVLRYSGDTYLQADVNGDELIDFVLKLDGRVDVTEADFSL